MLYQTENTLTFSQLITLTNYGKEQTHGLPVNVYLFILITPLHYFLSPYELHPELIHKLHLLTS